MLPLVLALLVPTSFARVVEDRLASTTMHVADWWADDLNGDDIPESIAFVCDDDGGFFLVRHGADLLEAPVAIDGRNWCPKPDSTPLWRVTHAGVIAQKMDVHHGRYDFSFALRRHELAVVREDRSSWDVNRDTFEERQLNYDDLTWSERIKPPHQRATQTSGPLVLVTDQVRRPSKLIGASTIAATWSAPMIHIHADRVLILRDCSETPCKTIRIAKGDSEVAIAAEGELEVYDAKTKIVVHFRTLEKGESHPHRPLY